MKRFLLLALLLCTSVESFALTQTEAKAIYEADTKKVLAGDLHFDWKEYRLAANQGGVAYFDWHPVRARFSQQMNKGDLQEALKSANEIIDHDMAEPEGHLLALIVFQKLGRAEDAHFQYQVVHAYVDSIEASGDGKSSKTAFVVVSVDEEYFYLNLVMGVGLPKSQSLVVVDGHSYDQLKVVDQDGKSQDVWFNVDISMDAMRDAMGESKKK